MKNSVIAIIAVLLLLSVWSVSNYNEAVALDETVKTAWGQVENQLKRRYDLIPNLVETVKGYAAHEKEVFEHIADARTKYFQAKDPSDQVAAAQGMERALSRLLVLQETYPTLKANETFLKLQDELAGTENRIAVERGRYNEKAKKANIYRRSFFGRIFAGWAGLNEAKYFETPEKEKEAPKVKF